ncbi:unnamed protein product, partial [Effrenium voratum]
MAVLDVKSAGLEPADLDSIALALQDKSHNITAVDVSGNDLGEEGGAKVLELFMQNQLVRRLAMNSNELGDEAAAVCAKVLAANTTIEELELQGNSIFIDGVKLLAEA